MNSSKLYQLLNSFLESDPKNKKLLRWNRYHFIPFTLPQLFEHQDQVKSQQAHDPILIRSYVFQEAAYFVKNKTLPTLARGLFMNEETREIVIRGYDKFFNMEEREETKWSNITTQTKGPYELLVKENGCLFLVSAYKGSLIVSSKHSLFSPSQILSATSSEKPSHAAKGVEWLHKHLLSTTSTEENLIEFLQSNNVTAAFELADDGFEEHLLEYPSERRGLYIHSLIKNTPDLEWLPFEQCEEFAQRFGCHVVQRVVKDDIDELKTFLDECKEKGMYKDSHIEGFVIRCVRTTCTDAKSQSYTPFLFKCKFEEPYGMFREWRAATQAVLNGSVNTFRAKYALTESYINWVLKKQKDDPLFFVEYMKNKGVIRARNAFLLETNVVGGTNTDLIRLAQESSHKVDDRPNLSTSLSSASEETEQKILIMPVAVPGVGKTTLGRTLLLLFPGLISHIQNDNIASKSKKSAGASEFERRVLEAFRETRIVYADRNNHLFPLRYGLSRAFKAVYPQGKILALQWDIIPQSNADSNDKDQKKALIDFLEGRILSRGDNHQSLTPANSKFRSVIASFVFRNDPVNLAGNADQFVEKVVPLSMQDDVVSLVKTVMNVLGGDILSSSQELDDSKIYETVREAMQIRETFRKVVQSSSVKSKSTETPSTPPIPKKKLQYKYFGLRIDAQLFYNKVVDAIKELNDTSLNDIWKHFESHGRISRDLALEKGFHVTLAINNKTASVEHFNLYNHFLSKLRLDTTSTDTNDRLHLNEEYDKVEVLPLGTPCTVTIDSLYTDKRLLVVSITQMSPQFPCANAFPHITIATISDDVKAAESNVVLAAYHTVDALKQHVKESNIEKYVFREPLVVPAIFDGFRY